MGEHMLGVRRTEEHSGASLMLYNLDVRVSLRYAVGFLLEPTKLR